MGLEIFVNEVYRCPETGALASVRNIVDVGANIGLSCVYWAQKFTSSKFWLLSPDANTWVAYIRPTKRRTWFTLGRLSAGRYYPARRRLRRDALILPGFWPTRQGRSSIEEQARAR